MWYYLDHLGNHIFKKLFMMHEKMQGGGGGGEGVLLKKKKRVNFTPCELVTEPNVAVYMP